LHSSRPGLNMALHTDYEFRWKNFRAFKDTDWLRIRPLTVLIGPNNSGKTSIISPLLLLDQTITSRDSATPLVTRGPLVDAGSFKNIVHNHDTSQPLFFGLRYHLHEPKGMIGKIGTYPPGGLELTLRAGKRPEDIFMEQFAVFDFLKRPFLSQSRNRDGTYSLESKTIALTRPRELQTVRESKPMNFLFSPSVPLRRLQSLGKKPGEKISFIEPSRGFGMYLSALAATLGEVTDLFRALTYVGPLRQRPQRYYSISGELPTSVGSRGEHMANLVRRRLPELRRQLNSWIRRFEFGSGLEIEDLSDEFFSLFFAGENSSRTNIAEAGFGASQVLPLIVQALAATEGSLTIAEQPEIHLNPKLQHLLADLFVGMAKGDHRVIVETHSEHLLLRLRRLVAEGEIQHSKVALYFVEKVDGVSSIRNIPIEGNGHIPENSWPRGFFEDTLGESLALATAQSVRKGGR